MENGATITGGNPATNNAVRTRANMPTTGDTGRKVRGVDPNDTTPPTFEYGWVNGATFYAVFNELLDHTLPPPADAFNTIVDSVDTNPTIIAVSGRLVTLGRATAADSGQRVGVSYNQPESGNPLQDLAGNLAADFPIQELTNVTGDDAAPALRRAVVDGAALTLTYARP